MVALLTACFIAAVGQSMPSTVQEVFGDTPFCGELQVRFREKGQLLAPEERLH